MSSKTEAAKTLNGYQFDIARTKRIKKYANAQFYFGRGIRWLIEDEKGDNVYCDKCGNFANCVLRFPDGRYVLNIPICNKHAAEFLSANADFAFNQGSLTIAFKPLE